MLSWIIQITIISIVLIFLVHYLFNFFKSTLTVPKIKDLVNSPNQKYENMFNIISKNNFDTNIDNNLNTNYEYTIKDLLPKQETEMKSDMKSELKNFLKKQLTTNDNTSTSTSITALDSMMSNSYSDFK
jgi:Tfp pilus tip-associated adhesin PilY1